MNTKSVKGRREVHYETFDDLLRDAESLAGRELDTLGNWNPGQILKHLALGMDFSIDGGPFQMPAPVRWLLRLTMKRKFLTETMSPGFKMSDNTAKRAVPPESSTFEEGLIALQRAIERQRSTAERAPNGALGTLTVAEWEQFHLRHAELHMSFIVPKT